MYDSFEQKEVTKWYLVICSLFINPLMPGGNEKVTHT